MDCIDELIQQKYSFKDHDLILRQFLIYEFSFLSSDKIPKVSRSSPSNSPISEFSLDQIPRQNYKEISFASMQNYYPLPMIMIKSLIHGLDKRKKGKINKDEYVEGFLSLYNGNFDKKVNFIFDMFSVNGDEYIHYEDVKCILVYTHIYLNKYKLDLLKNIISRFFNRKKKYTRAEFKERTYKKDCDLFFVILSLLFEKKTFTLELLSVLSGEILHNLKELQESKEDQKVPVKRTTSKFSFKDCVSLNKEGFSLKNKLTKEKKSDKFLGNILSLSGKAPNSFCIEYVLTNFNVQLDINSNLYSNLNSNLNSNLENDASLLRYQFNSKLSEKGDSCSKRGFPSPKLNANISNYGLNKTYDNKNSNLSVSNSFKNIDNVGLKFINLRSAPKDDINNRLMVPSMSSVISEESCRVNNSNIFQNKDMPSLNNLNLLNNNEDDDLDELNDFENDFQNFKNNLEKLSVYITQTCLPKFGVNKHILCQGVFVSSTNVGSNDCSPTVQRSNSTKSFALEAKLPRNSQYSIRAQVTPKPKSSFSKLNNISKFSNNSSFSDYQIQNFNINKIEFEEEIYVYNEIRNKVKKYMCYLNKGFNFVIIVKIKTENLINDELKKEVNDFSDNFQKNISSFLKTPSNLLLNLDNPTANQNPNDFFQVKYLIPLNHLFIRSAEENFYHRSIPYYRVNLCSTVLYSTTSYTFLFDKSQSIQYEQFKKTIISLTKYIRLQDEYKIIKSIDQGAYAKIELVRGKNTNYPFAAKKLRKISHSVEEFTSINWERDIYTFLLNFQSCDNLIKIYQIIETLEHLYYVTEYVKTGSLYDYIKGETQSVGHEAVYKIIKQTCNGVKELHNYGIVHRDLKLENILIDYKDNRQEFTCKIIDFGLSQVITPFDKANEPYGTIFYSAPEIFLMSPYDYKVDMWSIGIIAFYLLYTFMPFDVQGDETDEEIRSKIILNKLDIPEVQDEEGENGEDDKIKIIRKINKIIKECLNKQIANRWGVKEVIDFIKKM